MKFIAVLDKCSIDSEGESTVIMKVPLEFRLEVLEVMKYTEKPLIVEIQPSEQPYYEAIKVHEM